MLHMCTCVHVHARARVCVHVHARACVCACVRMRVCECVHSPVVLTSMTQCTPAYLGRSYVCTYVRMYVTTCALIGLSSLFCRCIRKRSEIVFVASASGCGKGETVGDGV